ncbi:MAG TPA: right-handed parallel beta-helix repeat-containing protein, partial [Flavobacteriales bacterium]|nr:right-handed parallel beta-helix repeat-containing protein [Flavobacteriales bacterium]
MEFISVPVPGACNLFYLLSVAASAPVDENYYYNNGHVQWSILDLDAENPRFPEDPSDPYFCPKRGRLLEHAEIQALPQFQGFDVLPETYHDPGLLDYTSERVGYLETPAFSKSKAPMIRVAQSLDGNSWMCILMNDRVHLYHITSSGIHLVDALPNEPDRNWVQTASLDPSDKPYNRDADMVVRVNPNTGNEELVLAMTDPGGLKLWPDLQQPYSLLVHRYNGTTGAFLASESAGFELFPNPSQCNGAMPAPGVPAGLRGCALTSNGNSIYLVGERTPDCTTWEPFAIHLSLSTGAITDIAYAFGQSVPVPRTRTRIYRNRAPHKVGENLYAPGDAIYLPGDFTVGALIGIEDPNALVFEPDVFGGVGTGSYQDNNNNGFFLPKFLNVGVAADRYLSTANRESCCVFLGTHGSGVVGRHEQFGNATWSEDDNPYGDQQELIFTCDLVVKPGANLFLNNLTLRFAPDAKVVVERGGRMESGLTTFTSLTCPNKRWPGIRVEGNTANPYQGNNPALPVDQEQGRVGLQSCTVENARYGVWCARELAQDVPDQDYYGGHVRALFSTFRDCITGVHVSDYHRFDGNDPAVGPEMPNRNFFAGCVFETTEDWPGEAPVAMGVLQNVRHVRFLNCSFANEAPQLFPYNVRGTGLWLQNSLAYVDGSGNPEQSYFRDLGMGVFNTSGLFNPVRVQRMHFERNRTGIFDANSISPEYGSNTFHVVDPAVPEVAGVGIYLWETKEFTVEDNTFTGNQEANTVGIYFYGQQAGPKGSAPEDWTYYEERIYNNSFTGLQGGTAPAR